LSLHGGVAHHVKTLISSPLKDNFEMDYFRVGIDFDESNYLFFSLF